eukprot:359640-Pyramimonas_sp.AAC.1
MANETEQPNKEQTKPRSGAARKGRGLPREAGRWSHRTAGPRPGGPRSSCRTGGAGRRRRRRTGRGGCTGLGCEAGSSSQRAQRGHAVRM